MQEEWKQINGFEDKYLISNKGEVKSLKNNIILKSFDNKRGYLQVTIQKESKRFARKIHRLVAIHFIPNPLNLPQVNHIDGIKTNNNVTNLEWCDNTFNVNHAIKLGLVKKRFGKDHHNSKKVINTITGIIYDSIKLASKDCPFGCCYLAEMLGGRKTNKTNFKFLKN